ncbi:hypothetical protein GBN32_17435 [Plesiomonas shigelloides]|uniref:hypothetical protein n=1 Tax=Plesiomonas shigelloides TaxID=703 RepID=UPI0012626333|nr:hypothetical protein [Plesiomonas shigelloides]KAB7704576.1 hypothetical protein GBN32_17435 [Plesiomonas shigelloides]
MDIRLNLENDLNNLAARKMRKANIQWDDNSNISIFEQYTNLLNRSIEPKPRAIKTTPNLICPASLVNGYNTLIFKLLNGLNVNTYLSSNIKLAHYNDDFLNDFGFHHFHLGSDICKKGKSKGFVTRTGPILIAYITDSTAYLIGIYQHGKTAPHIWAEQALVETMHNLWPEAIAKFRVNGISTLTEKLTSEERMLLRKKAYNTFLEMSDGTIYGCIGGGITAAKTNVNLTIEYDKLILHSHIIIDNFAQHVSSQHQDINFYPMFLKVIDIKSGLLIFDETNNTYYILKYIGRNKIEIVKFVNHDIIEHYDYSSKLVINKITESVAYYRLFCKAKSVILNHAKMTSDT